VKQFSIGLYKLSVRVS